MSAVRDRTTQNLWRGVRDFLFQVSDTLPEPDRRRARLLSILLLTLLILITSAFAIAIVTNPLENPFSNPATPVAISAVVFIMISYRLNMSGHYILAARLLVLIATIGAWAATLANRQPEGVDPLILAFVLESVLLSSILLRVRDTALVVMAHWVTLILTYPILTTPGISNPTMTNAIIFIAMTSGLLVVGAYVTQFDLAQINRQTQALIQSERRFRALVENSSDAIVLLDKKGVLTYQSPPAARILGYEFEEATQDNLFMKIHADDREDAVYSFEAILEDPTRITTTQYRVQHKNGTWRWIETIGKNMLADPTVSAIVANYRDISERKQAEEQIQRQVQYLNALHEIDLAIANSLDIYITAGVILEKTTAELDVNAARLFLLDASNQTLEFLAGRGFHTKLSEQPHPQLDAELAGRVVATKSNVYIGNINESEDSFARTISLDKEEFVSYVGVPLIAKGRIKGVLEVFQRSPLDPTPGWFEFLELLAGQSALALENAGLYRELQEYTAELENRVSQRTAELQTANQQLRVAHEKVSQALEQERELGELKSRFLSTTSHEFRTPLTTIFASAELLEHYGDKWPAEKQMTHLKRIQATVTRMTALLDDVLLVSRADAGKLEFQPRPMALAPFFQEIAEELQVGQGAEHLIVLHLRQGGSEAAADKTVHEMVYEEEAESEDSTGLVIADERLLRIITTNLLSNAIKYSPLGSRVELEVQYTRSQLHFSVSDQGIGIPLQDQSRLFDPFHRAANVATIPGTGLGLNIVRNAVSLHRGTITFRSEPGQGTTFFVTLMLPPTQDGSQSPDSAGQL